jgi:hypothetical protein
MKTEEPKVIITESSGRLGQKTDEESLRHKPLEN